MHPGKGSRECSSKRGEGTGGGGPRSYDKSQRGEQIILSESTAIEGIEEKGWLVKIRGLDVPISQRDPLRSYRSFG